MNEIHFMGGEYFSYVVGLAKPLRSCLYGRDDRYLRRIRYRPNDAEILNHKWSRAMAVEWMDCPDCDDGLDYINPTHVCCVCNGDCKIPVDMSEKGMIAAGLGHRISKIQQSPKERRSMEECSTCSQEMTDGVSCVVEKFPDGSMPLKNTEDPCHDCAAPVGGFHHPGCDTERCPKCEGQAISCGCFESEMETS